MEAQRHYLHGDILEDGVRYYNARLDSFEFLPAPTPSAIDVERYRRQLRVFEPGRRIHGPTGIGPSFRPDDAENLYAGHALMKAHSSTLRAAVRKAREEEDRAKRSS